MPQAQVIPLQRADRRTAVNGSAPEPVRRPPVRRPTPPTEPTPLHPLRPPVEDASLQQRLAGALSFLRKRITGDYPVDEFGFDRELTDTLLLPPLRLLYRHWFRVEVTGARNLPTDGGALVVCNHSGTLPLDAVMTALAVHDNHPRQRHLRMLGADLVFQTPVLGALARKTGQTLACNPDAERL